jgi:2,3-diaminopropionate biosynthesis protein SbnB
MAAVSTAGQRWGYCQRPYQRQQDLAEVMMRSQPGTFLYLDQEDVVRAGALDMARAIDRVELALSLLEEGDCVDPPKSVLRWSEDPEMESIRGRINFLSAYLGGPIDSVGMKWIGSFPSNRERGIPRATALIILNDPATGVPVALMEGSIISAIRTGAMTGVAAKYLARPDTSSVGIIGTGVQSRTQLLALCAVLESIREVKIYNRTRETAVRFATEMGARTGKSITIVDSPEDAVRGLDLALVATTAHQPLMKGAWLSPGMLTVQFSGHECDFEVIHRAQKIVCDQWETVKHRGITTPAIMHSQGKLDDSAIYADLGEIVTGKKPGRESPDELIHFAAIGLGVNDVAVASMVFDTATKMGIGTPLSLWKSPMWF